VIDGSATPAVTAARLLGGASRLIRNGAVTAVLTCPAAASRSCRGTVRILARLPGQRTNRGGPRRERVVGSRAYSIRLGRRARIRIPLGRAIRKLVARRGWARARLVVRSQRVAGMRPARATSRPIVLLRPGR
jgi:hypothetical protein